MVRTTTACNLPSFGTDLGNPSQEEWLSGVFTASDFTNPALGTFANQRHREEMARWSEDWEQLRTQFRMSFEPDMQRRIDAEQKEAQEARRKRS